MTSGTREDDASTVVASNTSGTDKSGTVLAFADGRATTAVLKLVHGVDALVSALERRADRAGTETIWAEFAIHVAGVEGSRVDEATLSVTLAVIIALGIGCARGTHMASVSITWESS